MTTRVQRGFWNGRAGAFTMTGLGLISTTLMISAAATPATAVAATWPVTNCSDSGSGSLRDAISRAADGDTVDLTQVGCGRIRLAGQPITISQADLNIIGPGRYKLAIDGDYRSGVLRHMGAGVLRISDLSVEHGEHVVYDGDGDAFGGCIYSAGDVGIAWVEVRHCGAHARVEAGGGGIYAQGNVAATQSVVHSNRVSGARPRGGGIATGKSITLDHSRIVNNRSGMNGGGLSAGVYSSITTRYSTLANNVAQIAGAAEVFGKAEILNSAVYGNSASYKNGAFQINELTLVNSTVSGNTAPFISAIETRNGLVVSNSTIAYNSITQTARCDDDGAVYVWVYADDPLPPLPPHLDSSIFANNSCNGGPGIDIHVTSDSSTVVPITGANNLVMQSTPSTGLPEDTISADPQLEPLADNGGTRLTHALSAGSPAIDAGNNAAGLTYDQRGPGYPRTKGAATDIGAYER